ncbi:hypothetical protein CMQ_7180 [Grosmannia clavigera kw1407]|uniref:TM7S3/TM198-like domain-containing protein n=1 Tax=Grosmannia clavigera (strain kw1407 / UAMH 11150) TaxID=655863 RepID=F0XPZ0_GROCL|nr:uncharacterized protein CMQ_7180 [Grosmannia clavigera kw1407]EFX00178.1 hypothetical protein CMQ_7180 [Grosmannia clavigera kw1407]
MLPRRHWLVALCSLLYVDLALAGVINPLLQRRAEQSTTAAAAKTEDASSSASPVATSSTAATATSSDGAENRKSTSASHATTTATATATTSASTSTLLSSVQASSTIVSTTSSLNLTFYNSTIASGQLPLKPEVTPGWGVAGAIMIITGVVYALIGIKKRSLHICLSTAYMTSLGTTVLIIYVMSPPFSHAVQGGFVAAAVCTGLILGGGAFLFKEITEGLGCMLGGFCFSMWLLCLHKGGLLPHSTGKIIFIVAFTIGFFAFYCSHWTRQYALIACISFSGATVTVLGIDAFSRAGLKEFWAYIWNLNNNLFPLGADTYPLTRGIRVEIAVIIVIFLAGIVSQLKLWHIVQERRAKRDAERAEDERALQLKDEEQGRRFEETNARERKEWEAKYGNGETGSNKHNSTTDSGVGDMGTEKGVSIERPSRPQSRMQGAEDDLEAASEPIELVDMQPQPKAAAEMILEHDAKDGALTVCVAADDYPEGMQPSETGVDGVAPTADVAAGSTQKSIRKVSNDSAGVWAAGPEIVPLPFKIPTTVHEEEAEAGENCTTGQGDNDDRSSVATFADEDEVIVSAYPHRRSLAKRLSQGSADLLRGLSKRASPTQIRSNDGTERNESKEELLSSPQSTALLQDEKDKDDSSSLAATIDETSSKDSYSVRDEEEDVDVIEEQSPHNSEVHTELSVAIETVEPVATTAIQQQETTELSAADLPTKIQQDETMPETPNRKTPSAASAEWTPLLEANQRPQPVQAVEAVAGAKEEEATTPTDSAAHGNETPRPVNVDELQQTAETGTPAPAAPRRSSLPVASRSGSYQSLGNMPAAVRGSVGGGFRSISSGHLARHTSALHNEPIAEEDDAASADADGHSPTSPTSPGLTPYSGPQTLIGRREMLLRSKSQGFYIGGPITQHIEASMSMPVIPSSGTSDNGSGSAHDLTTADLDDLPMNKRHEIMMRQQSYASIVGADGNGGSVVQTPMAGIVAFDSHQPKRGQAKMATNTARQSQLAAFRSSVALDLNGLIQAPAQAETGSPRLRESVSAHVLQNRSTSTASLMPTPQDVAHVKQSIEQQRNYMLGLREAEAQRREIKLQDKARTERAFEERMRKGDLMAAHRDAMRRMQASAREL